MYCPGVVFYSMCLGLEVPLLFIEEDAAKRGRDADAPRIKSESIKSRMEMIYILDLGGRLQSNSRRNDQTAACWIT